MSFSKKRKREFTSEKFQSCFALTFASSKISTNMKESRMVRTAATIKVVISSLMEVRRSSLLKSEWVAIKSTSSTKNHLQDTPGLQRSGHKLKSQTNHPNFSRFRLRLSRRVKLQFEHLPLKRMTKQSAPLLT